MDKKYLQRLGVLPYPENTPRRNVDTGVWTTDTDTPPLMYRVAGEVNPWQTLAGFDRGTVDHVAQLTTEIAHAPEGELRQLEGDWTIEQEEEVIVGHDPGMEEALVEQLIAEATPEPDPLTHNDVVDRMAREVQEEINHEIIEQIIEEQRRR